ncbi:MAG: hypothetical protein JXD19_03925 [Deltaproteobacteria bacterium]|nr:hypothetical protein [Deltaproteobacteria bacterium]
MQSQLALLRKLQVIDNAVTRIDRIQSEYPKKLEHIEKESERRGQQMERERASLEAIRKERQLKEQKLKIEDERLKKSEQKLFAVKTNKEYHAVLMEIQEIKRASSDIETEILICMEKGDCTGQELRVKEVEYQKWVQDFEKRKRELAAEIEKSRREFEERQGEREEIAAQIDSDLMKKYDILREKRQGLAVVPIEGGLCQGCNMDIPPQQALEIRKNHEIIMNCPFCNRMLYFEENPSGENCADK